MPKQIIAVDIDDVLVPHFQDLIAWYNREYGTKLRLADNYSDDLRVWGTKTDEEAILRVHRYYDTPEFASSRPFHEAETVLRDLSTTYDLVLVTARDTIIEAATREWVEAHFGELFQAVHFTAHYSLEGRRRTKADLCVEIGARYLIDDTPHHALAAAEVGVRVLLFGNYPWNDLSDLPDRVTRCKDWPEVREYFGGILQRARPSKEESGTET